MALQFSYATDKKHPSGPTQPESLPGRRESRGNQRCDRDCPWWPIGWNRRPIFWNLVQSAQDFRSIYSDLSRWLGKSQVVIVRKAYTKSPWFRLRMYNELPRKMGKVLLKAQPGWNILFQIWIPKVKKHMHTDEVAWSILSWLVGT